MGYRPERYTNACRKQISEKSVNMQGGEYDEESHKNSTRTQCGSGSAGGGWPPVGGHVGAGVGAEPGAIVPPIPPGGSDDWRCPPRDQGGTNPLPRIGASVYQSRNGL